MRDFVEILVPRAMIPQSWYESIVLSGERGYETAIDS